jgi:hypothetical protein
MTPKDKLKALEAELQAALSQSDKVAKLKAEIATLKKLISDQESGENQYTKEYAGVVQDQTKKKALSDSQGDAVKGNMSDDERKRVVTEVSEVDAKISALGKKLDTASAAAAAAWTKLTQKKEATKKAQDDLAALKEPWKAAQKALKDVDTLLASVDQQIQAKNYLVAYFLINETQARFKGADLDTPDVFSKKLATATEAAFEATDDEQAAKDDFDQKTADKSAAQKEADDAKSKRQYSIIRRINEGTTAPAGAGAGAGSKPVAAPVP